jgi:hypothetical protein
LSDPLIRSLDRKQPEEHTSHHYLVKTKNTGTGGLKTVLGANHPVPQPGKLLDHDPKNEASSQREKKKSGVVAT